MMSEFVCHPMMIQVQEDSSLLQAIVEGRSVLDLLALIHHDPDSVRRRGINGDYPLHAACRLKKRRDDKEEYDVIILKLLDIFPQAASETNRDGQYPLHIAMLHHQDDDILLYLMDLYPEAVMKKSSDYSDSYAIHIACRHIHSVQVIQQCLEIYPEALRMYYDIVWKYYPIHEAIGHHQSIDVIRLFVQRDPSILQQRDNYGRTVLHYACRRYQSNHSIALVEYLLQFSDILMSDDHPPTPLSSPPPVRDDHDPSDSSGDMSCGLQKPQQPPSALIHVNATDHAGNTALHYLCQSGKEINDLLTEVHDIGDMVFAIPHVVQLLLHHPGIDIDRKNMQNETPKQVIDRQMKELSRRWASSSSADHPQRDHSLYQTIIMLTEMKRLLEEYPMQQKWHAYQYCYQHIADWSRIAGTKAN